MRDAMARACRSAKIPLHSSHDLRHRRGSLWHASGMPARELSERTGRSKESMSLDVYTPDAARRRSGRAGSVPAHIGEEVRHPHRGRGRPTCPAPSHVPERVGLERDREEAPMFGHRRRERAKRQREPDRTVHLVLQRNLAAYSMTRHVSSNDLGSPKPNAEEEPYQAEFRRVG